MASVYYEQGNLDMAILHYNRAISSDTGFLEAYNNLVGFFFFFFSHSYFPFPFFGTFSQFIISKAFFERNLSDKYYTACVIYF